MDNKYGAFIWGILLILGGILALLFNFDVLRDLQPLVEYTLTGLGALAGLGFLIYYVYHRTEWWLVMPGVTLIGVSGMIYLSTWGSVPGETLTSILPLALAVGFASVYLINRSNWWAIIPAGILLVIGAVVLLRTQLSGETLTALLFTGIGLVFIVVYLLGPVKREVWWALIPGTALVGCGLFAYALTGGEGRLPAKLWPVVPLGGGILLIGRQIVRRRAHVPPPKDALPAVSPVDPTQGEMPTSSKTSVIEIGDSGKGTPSA
jgi:hypothetical protein